MPLSDEVRRELAAIEPQRDCDRLAELSGLFHTAGSLHLLRPRRVLGPPRPRRVGGRPPRVRAPARVRRRGRDPDVQAATPSSGATRYQIHVPGGERAAPGAVRAGVLSRAHAPLEAPPKRVVGRPCCRRAYLRGAFLGAGSVSGPRSPHLEIRTASRAGAELLAAVAAQEDVLLRVHDRGRHAAAYAKGAEPIADALALVGAGDAALALDEHAVVAEARARANRVANADHANLVRASRAAHAQITRDPALEAEGALARLSPPLARDRRAAAPLPVASLRELAAKCRPPATKAAAHRRLSRLVALASHERYSGPSVSFRATTRRLRLHRAQGPSSARRGLDRTGGRARTPLRGSPKHRGPERGTPVAERRRPAEASPPDRLCGPTTEGRSGRRR